MFSVRQCLGKVERLAIQGLENEEIRVIGERRGEGSEFCPNKWQTEHSNWLRTLVCQSNVLAFFEGHN